MNLVKQEVQNVQHMTLAEFNKISEFIYTQYGIKLPPVKKTMLESRLHKRLRALKSASFKEYFEYVFSPEGKEKELIHMVDLVTTNKTDFFREASHFTFLTEQWLPEWMSSSLHQELRIWSAGCSSGEEPYTLAMVLSEYEKDFGSLNFSILGTDLSSQILQKALSAVYTEEKAVGIPLNLKKKYLLRSKDSAQRTVRIIPSIRSKVSFMRLNFMDSGYEVPGDFNVIFCRNVLIYFDRITQQKVINRLCRKLKPGGYLFLGHSESITNMDVPLKQIKPTIFMKL